LFEYFIVTENHGILQLFVSLSSRRSSREVVLNRFRLKPVKGKPLDALKGVQSFGKVLMERGHRPVRFLDRKRMMPSLRVPSYVKENRPWNVNDYYVRGEFPPSEKDNKNYVKKVKEPSVDV